MKKKWFIIILIILVIAVVLTIVFINLFTPKTTTELTNQLYTITEKGYLYENNEDNKKIDDFMKFLQTSSVSRELEEEEKNLIANYAKAYEAFEVLADFYNREMVFTRHTDVYKNERKTIMDSFNNASKAASNMANYIRGEEGDVNGEAKWTADMWRTIDDQMISLYNNTANAFNHLAKVYTSCVTSKIMNNDLTTVLFRAVNHFTDELSENGKVDNTCGTELLNFTNRYFTKDGEHFILDYQYNANEITWVHYLMEATEDITQAENGAWERLVYGDIKSVLPSALTEAFGEAV